MTTSRRTLLSSFLAVPFVSLTSALALGRQAPLLPLTRACEDGDEPTLSREAGPFFKPNAPLKQDLFLDAPSVNSRYRSEQEYRTIDDILRKALEDRQYQTTVEMIRVIALTGCRRNEVIVLRWGEVDIEGHCLSLADSKEGASVRSIGLPVLEHLEGRRDEEQDAEDHVFAGWEDGTPFGSFPRQWTKLLKESDLATSRRMFCETASPASATILAS